MKAYRYSEWDGNQNIFNMDADQLMNELDSSLMRHGDLPEALRDLWRRGLRDNQGRQLPSLEKLLQQLRQMRQNQLDRYDLGSVMDEIRQKLDKIQETERQGIQKQLDEAREKAGTGSEELPPELTEKLKQAVENRSAQNLEKLNNLPSDIGGQVKELMQYDFMDNEAREMFQELLDQLKKNAMQAYMRDLTQALKNMDASSMAGIRNLVEGINQMLEARMRGEEPDFDGFMEQFGDFFGSDRPRNFEEMMNRLREQMEQAQALMDSLSPEDRQALDELLKSMFDEATQQEFAKLGAYMNRLYPSQKWQRGYPFSGDESVSFNEAMKLMETLQKMDELEEQVREARMRPDLDNINSDLVKELMGEEAARQMEALRDMARLLEEAGYIRRKGDGYELTPQAIRRIGQKALKEILAHLKTDRSGPHTIDRTGAGIERIEETRKYESGDDFHLHVQKTIMNSILRHAGSPPVRLDMQDFEILKTEESTRSAIVLLLDQSHSMFRYGYFEMAKRVAIALENLISTRYPKDSLFVIGFSGMAHEIKRGDLLQMPFPYFERGTNYQHALYLARKLLSKQNCANKEILLISDGQPTAFFEGGEVYHQYPPTMRALQMTLKEVRNCTQKGIVINTFMFDDSPFFTGFVSQIAQINKGRVFFTSPDGLGKYLLLDYLAKKRRRLM
ncbi:MAG: hypothetical protein Q8O55_09815 [Dehalococcoidales bacterium]|nr:hypothetical protein [Dehalococcoidales bacterium]